MKRAWKKAIIIVSAIVLCLAMLFGVIACLAITLPTMKYADDGTGVVYNGRLYIYEEDTTGFWRCNYDGDGMNNVGWHWYILPFLGKVEFYAENTENPDYICSVCGPSDVYFREGYDYTQELFEIHGHPQVSIRFADSYNKDSFIEANEAAILSHRPSVASFEWSPEGHPALYNCPEIYLIFDRYYIQFAWDQPLYEIDDEFLAQLMDEGIIK